jgi:hypothetical protein
MLPCNYLWCLDSGAKPRGLQPAHLIIRARTFTTRSPTNCPAGETRGYALVGLCGTIHGLRLLLASTICPLQSMAFTSEYVHLSECSSANL